MGNYYWILNMISKGQKGLAIKELTKILKTDSQDVEAWSLLALAVDEPTKKADCYRKILQIDPENQHAKTNLQALATPAVRDTDMKEEETAGTTAKQAPIETPTPSAPQPLQITPPPATQKCPNCGSPIAGSLAFCPICNSQLVGSQQAASKVVLPKEDLHSIPNQAAEMLERGRNEIRAGNKPAGREWIRQAVQLNPSDDEAWLEYIRVANTDEFRLKIIQRWLAYDPQNQRAKQAMEELQARRPGLVRPSDEAKKVVREKPKSAGQKQSLISILWIFILGMVIVSITTSIALAPRYLVLGPYKETPTTGPETLAMVASGILSFVVLAFLWYLLNMAWKPPIRYEIIASIVELFVLMTPVGWYFVGKGALLLIDEWRDSTAG